MCWNRLNLTLAALFIATASQLQAGVIVTGSLTGTIDSGSDANNTLGLGMSLIGEAIVINFSYDTMTPPAPADALAGDPDLGEYLTSSTSDPVWFEISSVTIGGVIVPVSMRPLTGLTQRILVDNRNPSRIEYDNTRDTSPALTLPPSTDPGLLQFVEFELNGGAAGVFGSDALPLHVDLDDFANGIGTFLLIGNDESGTPVEGDVNINADFTITSFASSASVPEPSSIAMLGLGAIGLVTSGFLRRRKNLATAS